MTLGGDSIDLCENCEEHKIQIWWCVDCNARICELCWPKVLPHKPGKKGRDNLPHEPTNEKTSKRLIDILEPQYDDRQYEELHELDAKSRWFGKPNTSMKAINLTKRRLVERFPE